MGLFDKTERSKNERFGATCKPLGLDITGKDHHEQPRSNWRRKAENVYGQEDDIRDEETSVMLKEREDCSTATEVAHCEWSSADHRR